MEEPSQAWSELDLQDSAAGTQQQSRPASAQEQQQQQQFGPLTSCSSGTRGAMPTSPLSAQAQEMLAGIDLFMSGDLQVG